MIDPTIDSVRKEIREAIFWTIFQATDLIAPGGKDLGQQKAIGHIEFAARACLISSDEANEWLDAVWDRKSLAEVSSKCMEEK